MEEGKLLGHIISKDGIRIDPAHVQEIQQIDLPRNKKEIQSFNGKMNFLCRFVPNLAKHLREITNMLKKDNQVKWMEEAVKSFNLVKLALSSAAVLKRDDHERPIAFFSRAIRDAAIKYNIIENQALALVKALKDFRHRWILTATDYFTKWIKAIPTKQATNAVIISFLENNILSRFGFPNKLITHNAAAFKSKRMVEFCHKYHIILGHSTAYHPQGNGFAESSNKSLVNIIKKLLEINKRSWHKRLVNALWADWVSQKKSTGTSPFELVYGVDTVFPTSLTAPVVKLLQEAGSEEDPMQRRLNQMVHLQQTREEISRTHASYRRRLRKFMTKKQRRTNFSWMMWC
eukprot:PITA_11279